MKKSIFSLFFTFIFLITFSIKEFKGGDFNINMDKLVNIYKKSFSYKYLEISTKKKVFYSSIMSLLLAKSSPLLSKKIKKLKLLNNKQKIIGSFVLGYSASWLFDYFMQYFSFYNLRTEISQGNIVSALFIERILPTNIHTTAKFFNSLNEDDLKNFLLYFNIDKFIEITKSKHFSATKTVRLMEFYETKNNEEYLKLFNQKYLEYMMNPQDYPIQKAVSFINKAFKENKNLETLKPNLKNAFISLLKNHKLIITFMSFDDEVREYIISSLNEEEKNIFYEKILFEDHTASNFREQIIKIFETDSYKELFSFSTWYFDNFDENSQNEFLIRLLKLNLINNYANFLNSLKDKTLEFKAKNNFIKVMLRALNKQTKLGLKTLYYEKLFSEKCYITEKDQIISDIKNKLDYRE